MSAHRRREAAARTDATAWRDRVIDDVLRGKGRAAALADGVSIDLVIAAAERLDPCERIDSQDAPGSDVALWFSDIIGHEGGLANILVLYTSAIDEDETTDSA